MANETQIGQLVIDLKIRTEALEKGLETAKKKLQEIEQQNEQVKNNNSQLDASFVAMSASIVISLTKIVSAVEEGVNKYNSYVNSMKALQKTATATNNSMSDIEDTIKDVNKLRLMDESDLNSSIKNLLTYGFTIEQASDMLKVLQDAAVGNRQASYSLSEAVRVTTEGIRMENSVLSDAAGVQKNISKMYEDYAKSIGKSTDSLTQAEKVQAVYNGIMDEAAMFTGSAAEMAEGYQGQQAQLNASNLELSRVLGESMIPALTQYSSLQLSITKGLTEYISTHKSATAGTVAFTGTLLATVVALTTAKKAITAYKTAATAANMTTKAFTVSLMANPITLIAIGCATAVAGITMFNSKIEESKARMEEAKETAETLAKALEIVNSEEYSQEEKEAVKNAKSEAEEVVKIHEEKTRKIEELNKKIDETQVYSSVSAVKLQELIELEKELNNAKIDLQNFEEENFEAGESIDTYREKISKLTNALSKNDAKQEYLRLTNQKSHRETLINIAQTKSDIEGKQKLLNVLKEGKTSTDEYADAKNQLVKAYPELAKVNENTIASTQAAIDAENMAADAEWANAQIAIQASILEVNAMMSNSEQIQTIANATKQSVEEVTASLQNQINILSNLANLSPTDFKGSVTSSYTPKKNTKSSKSSSSYSNKALDDYKKEIEYKKSLDQISLQQEISMYQTALKKYAKTTDEKRELTTKIYELQKELQEKGLDDYTADIEHRKALDQISLEEEINMYQYAFDALAKTTDQKKELEEKLHDLRKELAQKNKELLNQQTTDYERYIEDQKNLRGSEYAVNERASDLDKIINMHQSYLNQILHDERLSLEERKEIYEEELDTIRDYEQQKRDLRIENIDNTVSQLTSAITKQIEEMQQADEDAINKNIELIEKWKDTRIDAINEEYDARIKAIQDELDALDKAEEQKTRDEEDTEYEKKKLRLEQLIAYEHDATTKANYEKELAKLIEDHNKTVDKRVLDDKKQALKDQQDILKDEQSAKIDAITQEAERQKEQLQTQLDNIKEYYDKQKEMAQQNAQAMLLNVEQNQEQILSLLQNYGDDYEITGQTFGEKLGQGFAETAMQKIQNAISAIQVTIDSAIESNIARLTSLNTKISSGVAGNTVINKTVNVEQNNTITSPVDSPSVAWKKQETLNRNLADSLSRVF